MRQALADPDLLGSVLAGESWASWRALLIAAMGEALTDEERPIFETLSGRAAEPQQRVEELWAIIGRRGGKSRAAAVLGAYVAGLCDWSEFRAPGERLLLPIMSATVWQAVRIKNYLDGVFALPAFAEMVESNAAEAISLKSYVDIECRPASFRTSRGATLIGAIVDEVAFLRQEGTANPDREILNALRPGLATTAGMLVCISSPHARRGELYRAFRDHHGPAGDPAILVARASSLVMNPTLSPQVIRRAFERDAAVAAAEYGGQFRVDVESFVSREVVEAAVVADRFELPPCAGVKYVAFTDPSGGSSDAMTLAIAHRDSDKIIIDAIRVATPPFSPDSVTADFAETMRLYHVSEVTGDRYAGEWPRERFRVHGIEYKLAEKPKSDLYRDALPQLNAGRVELLDHPKLIEQLCSLERRTARGGRDSIDHPPQGHDDIANCVAGAINLLSQPYAAPVAAFGVYSSSPSPYARRSNLSGTYSNA
ncbi:MULTISPECIES: hypothetical protein [Methylosinus]|uniref:Terminase n=1 Tax=Methylosinus trichosporium (strain ATCC 35070 / NCIMB 11131 / UNIQEM 75 / OB3b) TaxID=595536 RepID=A0A2D2CW50_METT3|nr:MULTISPECIES: hypothetical protein [Methylosinus]ATQ66896.1 hypothetical protein CQW49_02530 [Methylosinus trichosporium OB3b]OBS54140.1 hypothetical protein A8B73_02610 [Methylosinus sp. 3S-1]